MYKLIAIDMDGTLLNSDKIISERNKKAIQDARAQGVTVVLASGRPYEGMKNYLAELEMNTDKDFVLCFNAAKVMNLGTGEVIREILTTGKDAKRIAKLAKQHNCNFHGFSVEHGLIAEKDSKYTQHEANINGLDLIFMSFDDLADDHPMVKTMLVDPAEIIEPIVASLPAELSEEYSIVRSAPFFLEFNNPEGNKGSGVKALADHLGIAQSEVMCIGDAGNDHEMLKYAGLGVAMENADDVTKALSNVVTDTNNNSGVGIAIEKYVLNA
ncbi:HMP-PP hydrolase [Vibrio ishigakensis]|uniref:HMP-PP hydrolase n=1 Tax=Vibrio ishigakensis TaxID=1481914 RepID=A0A0B8QEX1_9VIBR|nr:HMP-PP hydrolase [Vibrio ishigakensis]